VVDDRSTSVLLVEGPDYDQSRFFGHINVVSISAVDDEDSESLTHPINEEHDENNSDFRTGTTPVQQENYGDPEEGFASSHYDPDDDDPDDDPNYFDRQVKRVLMTNMATVTVRHRSALQKGMCQFVIIAG
jgi:hypothetical protein